MRIILACDRSAGHIFPAKCVASSMGKEDVFLFVPSRYFKPLLREEGYRVFGVPFRLRNIILESFFRFWESLYIICRLRPHKVIGFGGRDTFFIILWAKIILINAVIYEPNAIMGKANKVLSLLTDNVYRGFYMYEASRKNIRAGIPIRDSLKKCNKKTARKRLGLTESLPVILCFGGSQGSEFINLAFKRFVASSKDNFQIIHITGRKQKQHFLEFYDKIDRKVIVYDFCREMELVYSAADFVICRAGALTTAEISYYMLPVLFIPYPGAGNHQYANAAYLEKKGACFFIAQKEFSFDVFSGYIEKLLKNSSVREHMADRIGKLKLAVDCRDFYRSFS